MLVVDDGLQGYQGLEILLASPDRARKWIINQCTLNITHWPNRGRPSLCLAKLNPFQYFSIYIQ